MKKELQLLLADDDEDERLFFTKVLQVLPIPTSLVTIEDGEKLINYLNTSKKTPDILFLDINMPRKNGKECLTEIKSSKSIKQFPIVIYSTCLNDAMADVLYKEGAYYYLRKVDFSELTKYLQNTLILLKNKKFQRPSREKFIINSPDHI
jgi:response regulator RpfG family c-di-GMP phosphodiesterase